MKVGSASARAIARALGECVSSTFQIEALESRRLLTAAAATIDQGFGVNGAAAPLPASMPSVLAAYNHLTPAGNGQFYAVAYDGGACYPSGYTAFQILRVNADGSLDTSFGDGGGVRVQRYDPTTLFGYEHFDYDSLLVGGVYAQSDGKVLVSYRAVPPGSPDPWVLARFNNDGSVDQSFGSNGVVEMPVGWYSQNLPTTWVQPSGKIDVADADTFHDDGAGDNITVRQFNSDGTPDETFGTDGVDQTTFTLAAAFPPPTPDQIAAATANGWNDPNHSPGAQCWYTTLGGATGLPDGTSVLYLLDIAELPSDPTATVTSYDQRVVALTIDPEGQVSSTAIARDQTSSPTNSWDDVYSLVVQPDGKAIIAAATSTGAELSRVNPDGSPDATFSTAELAIPDTTATVTGMWVQPDGKLIVAIEDDSHELTGLTRLNADGTADSTFAGGQTVYGFGDKAAIGGVLTTADGSVIVATDDAEVSWRNWFAQDAQTGTPKGAQLVRLTPTGGTAGAFDDAGAELEIQAAIAQKAADAAAALAAEQAAEDAAYLAQQAADEADQEAADANGPVYDDGTTPTDDGSTDDGSTDDTGSTDPTGDPSAYGDDPGISDSSSDGFFTATDGTTVWNPDGTPAVV